MYEIAGKLIHKTFWADLLELFFCLHASLQWERFSEIGLVSVLRGFLMYKQICSLIT